MKDSRHYSYTVYRKEEVARSFDEGRFGGPIGKILQESQEEVILKMIEHPLSGINVLDLGAGTGRISLPLARLGAEVIALDSSDKMLAIAEDKAMAENIPIKFKIGDAHEIPFKDDSFDYVISLRTLLHVVDWKKVISEVCRVSKNWVIIDFPPKSSPVVFAPILLRAKRYLLDHNTQVYRTFRLNSIRKEFLRHGFEVVEVHRGFALPIFLHRKINSPSFTKRSEEIFKKIGVTSFIGAPLTLKAKKT